MLEVLMPRLSDTMGSGTILQWFKQTGDPVQKGDQLFELETDKVTVIVEAEGDGLLNILAAERSEMRIGAPVATLLTKDEYERTTTVPAAPDPAAKAASAVDMRSADAVEPNSALARPASPDTQRLASRSGRARATPLARRLAAGSGIGLSQLSGSGPEGRILKSDVLRALRAPGADAAARRDEADELRPLTRMQETVARRMTAAKQEIPHYYLSLDVDMTDALALRQQVTEARISVTDLVVRATALVLKQVSEVNAAWVDGMLRFSPTVDIGIAVAVEDGGLLVPVIRDADRRSLLEIAGETRALAAAVHAGAIAPSQLAGGTFTISNLGMFGVREFYAIVNPPQSAILAVGKVIQTPAVHDGSIAIREIMSISLSADHRVFSGATAAKFLTEIQRLLERPLALLLPDAAQAAGPARESTDVGRQSD
jgi:pyruvate dehydrogenase E2 component (dihydrolipoamide acetyltransferase)